MIWTSRWRCKGIAYRHENPDQFTRLTPHHELDFRFANQNLGLTSPSLCTPDQADRLTWIIVQRRLVHDPRTTDEPVVDPCEGKDSAAVELGRKGGLQRQENASGQADA